MKRVMVVLGLCACVCFVSTANAQVMTGLSTVEKDPFIDDNICAAGAPCPPVDCSDAASNPNLPFPVDLCNLYADFDAQFPDVKALSVTFSAVNLLFAMTKSHLDTASRSHPWFLASLIRCHRLRRDFFATAARKCSFATPGGVYLS